MAGERTLVLGFETELNDDRTWSKHHVLHQVWFPGKPVINGRTN